jgi:hypothetical protein
MKNSIDRIQALYKPVLRTGLRLRTRLLTSTTLSSSVTQIQGAGYSPIITTGNGGKTDFHSYGYMASQVVARLYFHPRLLNI